MLMMNYQTPSNYLYLSIVHTHQDVKKCAPLIFFTNEAGPFSNRNTITAPAYAYLQHFYKKTQVNKTVGKPLNFEICLSTLSF